MVISVIIPTLNEETTIAETLRHTSGLGFEDIIVVDGGSSDRTPDVVRTLSNKNQEYCGIRFLTSPPGRGRQMNEGARACRGETLLFLHADSRLPDKAAQLIASSLTNPGLVGGRFDVRFDSSTVWARTISTFMNGRSRVSRISTGDQAIFVRREIFEQLGGFAEIPIMEDIDFSTRLKRLGPIVSLRETVTTSFRRWKQNGPLRTILLMWTLRFLYWLGISPARLAHLYKTVR
ncbi:TIGR04283 family arsenosugar biosynthesis glycosyltransferase [Petrachloros mirabilis]